MSCGVVAAALCITKARRHRALVTLVLTTTAIALIIALYNLKPDSANGRLLIWSATLDMIAQKPLFGWGAGAFKAHYMDFQAAWLMRHPGSKAAMLADNVPVAYNEYLNLLACYGLVGLAIFAAVAMWLVTNCLHKPSCCKKSALLVLLAIAVMSMSSYPLTYATSWTAIGLSFIPFVKPRRFKPGIVTNSRKQPCRNRRGDNRGIHPRIAPLEQAVAVGAHTASAARLRQSNTLAWR